MKNEKMDLKKYIEADVYRNIGRKGKHPIMKYYFKTTSPICFLIRLRICRCLYLNRNNSIWAKMMFPLAVFFWKRESVKLGFEINYRCEIGKGLRLPHCGSIVVHKDAVIGDNCEIMQCVTIGNNILKSREKVARIGDGVILCSGCKVIGDVTIGAGTVVGANAVVTKSFPDNVVVAGVPAKLIKELSEQAAINCDY